MAPPKLTRSPTAGTPAEFYNIVIQVSERLEAAAPTFGIVSKAKNRPAPSLQDPARNSAIATLAMEVMKANGKSLPSLSGQRGAEWWKSFRAATLQAERMLQEVESRGDEPIHAYRLFRCDPEKGSSPQNLRAIHNRFKEVGWKNGMSENTLATRIEEILKDIEEESARRREGFLVFLERHNFKQPEDHEIESFVKWMIEDFAISEVLGDTDDLEAKISGVVRRLVDKAMASIFLESGTSESPSDPVTIAYFMKFVCGHHTLEAAMQAKSKSQLQVRAYELFLYAHERDLNSSRLTKRRADLDPEFVPEPEYLSPLSIRVGYGGAEDMLVKWEKEDEENRRRLQALEKQVEEKLAVKRMRQEQGPPTAAQPKKKAAPMKKAPTKKAAKKKISLQKKAAKKRSSKSARNKSGGRK